MVKLQVKLCLIAVAGYCISASALSIADPGKYASSSLASMGRVKRSSGPSDKKWEMKDIDGAKIKQEPDARDKAVNGLAVMTSLALKECGKKAKGGPGPLKAVNPLCKLLGGRNQKPTTDLLSGYRKQGDYINTMKTVGSDDEEASEKRDEQDEGEGPFEAP